MHLHPIDEHGLQLPPMDVASGFVVDVVKAMIDLYARRGFVPPWIGYLAMQNGVCVGTCGFTSPPKDGEVEIAYCTIPDFEGQGVATGMARELIRSSRSAAGSSISYIAHTLPQMGASTTILGKLGFVLLGEILHPEDGVVWKWREAPQLIEPKT